MDVAAELREIALRLPDARAAPCWGAEGFFHRPPGSRARDGRLFLTVRAGPPLVVGLPLPRDTYEAWFGPPPPRPRAGERVPPWPRHGPFAPHPLMAWNAWAQAADPSEADLPALAWAAREAYGRVVGRGVA